VGRLDAIGTDPIAKTDARVVEVFILLDDSEAVSGYTNMQVEVEIQS
jgi:HlyD family secretion protein